MTPATLTRLKRMIDSMKVDVERMDGDRWDRLDELSDVAAEVDQRMAEMADELRDAKSLLDPEVCRMVGEEWHRRIAEINVVRDENDALLAKLTAARQWVETQQSEWRAEKWENEQEAERLGENGGFALERASKLEDCLEALDWLKAAL